MADARLRDIDGNLELVEDGKVKRRWKRKRGVPAGDAQPVEGKTHPEKISQGELHKAVLSDGTVVLVPRGTDIDKLPREVWPYGEVLGQQICQALTEGKSLNAVCKQEGFPPIHVVFKWRRQYPEFAAQVEEAMRMRASWAEEQILRIAETCGEDVKAERLKAELYQWVAEISDRRTYQRTTRLEQEIPKVNITIVTGVPDPDPIEVPSWDPKDDPEYQQAAEASPVFFQKKTTEGA